MLTDLEKYLKTNKFFIEDEEFYRTQSKPTYPFFRVEPCWMVQISSYEMPSLVHGITTFMYEGYEYFVDVRWHSNDVYNQGHTIFRCLLVGLV